MNSETSKERQKRLQHKCQNWKKQSDKENIALHPKRIINDNAVNDTLCIPKVRVYLWTSYGLSRHILGSMNHKCQHCGAMMWLNKRTNKSIRSPIFTTYCVKGKVILPFLQKLSPSFDILLTENDSRSCSFRQNI